MIAPRTPVRPVLDDYCNWLTENGGRIVRRQNRWGDYTVLHSPDDALCVVISDTTVNGLLVSELIEYLDSRLGLISPWNEATSTREEAADD